MKTIRWGLIGCGDVARKRVAAALQETPGSQLVAVCQRDAAQLDVFADRFQVARRETDAAALMQDPEIDAVYLATPVAEHHPHTLAAAAAGKHVLVEKPMAIDVGQCDDMIAACREANVRLGVAYYRRFYPVLARIEQLLDEAAIGEPLAIAAVTATPMAMAPGEEGYWRAEAAASGGGALMDVGSHRIDAFPQLLGPIEEVKAFCATIDAPYQVEDTATLLFRFQNGVLGTLQCHFGCQDPDEFTIQGTRGRLLVRPLNGGTLLIERDGEQTVEHHPPAENYCIPLVADFLDAVGQQRPPRVTGELGRATNLIMQCAYADAGIAIEPAE